MNTRRNGRWKLICDVFFLNISKYGHIVKTVVISGTGIAKENLVLVSLTSLLAMWKRFHYNENFFWHLITLVSDSWRSLFPERWKEIIRRKWMPVRLSLKTVASLLKWGLWGKLNQWFKEKEWKKLHMMRKLENTAITAVKIYDKLGYLFSLVAQSLKSEATCLLGKASECTLLLWMVDSYKKWNFVRFQKLQNQNVFQDIISNFNFWFFCLQLCTTVQNVISQDYCRICQTKFEAKDAVFREYGTSKNWF